MGLDQFISHPLNERPHVLNTGDINGDGVPTHRVNSFMGQGYLAALFNRDQRASLAFRRRLANVASL